MKNSMLKARLTHLAVLVALFLPVFMGAWKCAGFLGFSDGHE